MKEVRLTFGDTAAVYYRAAGVRLPGQMDLIDSWFPGLLITEEEGKQAAEYRDTEHRIYACRVHGRLYCGSNGRITQILGRLVGTARGNQEKERRTAEEIRIRLASELMKDPVKICNLQENAESWLIALNEESFDRFVQELYVYVGDLLEQCAAEETEEDTDEIIQSVLYNAVKQLRMDDWDGLVNAWVWMLLGGLLGREVWRLLQVYDSSFTAIRMRYTEEKTFSDQIGFLLEPAAYEAYYEGDDLDKRFPGIVWFCDRCGAEISRQTGFDDHLETWKCQACGHVNALDIANIYETREDYYQGRDPIDPVQFEEALAKRRSE